MKRTTAIVLLLFLLGLWVHVSWMGAWIATDERVSGQICCDLTTQTTALVVMDRMGYRPPVPLWLLHERGAMSWAALAVSDLSGGFSPDTFLWTQLWALAAAQGAMLWAVWPIAGPWGALVAALTLPVLPGIAFEARQWAPFTIQSFFLLLILGAALRGIDRLRWASIAVVAGYLGASTSRLITDDLLFLQAAGLVLGASVLRTAVTETTACGRRVGRARLAVAALVTAGAMLGAIGYAFSPRGDVLHHLSYYADELGVKTSSFTPTYTTLADPWSSEALLAYPRRFAGTELGRPWSALLLMAVPGLFLWGKGRAEVLAGGIGPLLILSAVAKKQIFYAYMVLPFVPVLIVCGLLAPIRTRTWLSPVLAAGLIVFLARAIDTQPPAGGGHTVPQWQHAVFQFPYPLLLHPQTRDGQVHRPADYLTTVLPQTCPVPLGVLILDADFGEGLTGEPDLFARLSVELLGAGLCTRLYQQLPQDGGTVDVLWVGGGTGGSCQVEASQPWARTWAQVYGATSWDVLDQRLLGDDQRCRTLLVRAGSRWSDTLRTRINAASDRR